MIWLRKVHIISLYNVHPPWREAAKLFDITEALKVNESPNRREREARGGREAKNHPRRGQGGPGGGGGAQTMKASVKCKEGVARCMRAVRIPLPNHCSHEILPYFVVNVSRYASVLKA